MDTVHHHHCDFFFFFGGLEKIQQELTEYQISESQTDGIKTMLVQSQPFHVKEVKFFVL